MAGRREVGGLPWVGEDRLIPLKAIAWLDLNARKEQGAKVDAKDVRKHLNDVLRLSQLLAPATRIPLVQKIGDDMTWFLSAVASDTSIDPKSNPPSPAVKLPLPRSGLVQPPQGALTGFRPLPVIQHAVRKHCQQGNYDAQ